MSTTRRQAAEQRKRHIRDVAVQVFARHGFAATTTKQIAKEAGVAEGLLFHYFPSKLDLLREVTSSYGGYRLAIGDVLSRVDPHDASAGLRTYGETLLAHLREHSDIMAVLAGESQLDGELSTIFWEVVSDMRTELSRWLDKAVAAGSVRATASTTATAAIVTAALSFFFLEHRRLPDDRWRPAVDQHLTTSIETVLIGITNPPR